MGADALPARQVVDWLTTDEVVIDVIWQAERQCPRRLTRIEALARGYVAGAIQVVAGPARSTDIGGHQLAERMDLPTVNRLH